MAVTLETELRAYLLNFSDIESAFGARIYDTFQDNLKENKGSFAVIWRPDTDVQYTYNNKSIAGVLIQIDVYNKDHSTCVTHARLIKTAISGFKGSWGTVNIGKCHLIGWRCIWDPDVRKYRQIMEVSIGTKDWA
jgi:hypothetical protein